MEQSKSKFNYGELNYDDDRQRSCYTPGRVYTMNSLRNIPRGFKSGDLLLCIKKAGDCFYEFVRIKYDTETAWSGDKPQYQIFTYYKLKNSTSSYGGYEESFPEMETLSETDLVHVLYSGQVLIPAIVTQTKLEYSQKPLKI